MYKASPQPYGVILVKTLLKLYCNKNVSISEINPQPLYTSV